MPGRVPRAAGLAPRQHPDVILVAIRTLPHHPQQLPLQARQLAGHVGQGRERQLAHAGLFQRDRFATMTPAAHRIQPEQLAWQLEAQHVFFALLIEHHGPERTFAGHIDRTQRIASAEQAIAAAQRAALLHQQVEPAKILLLHASRQAQLPQRAFLAGAAQARDVDGGDSVHAESCQAVESIIDEIAMEREKPDVN